MSQFSNLKSQFSLNDQISMFKREWLEVCKLLTVNLMEIENCKLKIAADYKGAV